MYLYFSSFSQFKFLFLSHQHHYNCISVFSPCQPLCSCHQDRVPFVVPERVPWKLMCSTLNSKFTSEVQTQHNLDQYNQHFLAQKIFDKPDFADDFSNMMVSWAQFNKVHTYAYPHTYTDIQTQISHCLLNLTGGSPRSTVHFLAVVWGSNGPDQEAPEDLLERRVWRLFCSFNSEY